MIATLTLNPSIDKTIYIEQLVTDDTNRATGFRYDVGGKGINVSRVLWELGETSFVFGFVGGDTGRKVEKLLRDEGLTPDFNWTDADTRENLVLMGQTAPNTGTSQTKISLPGPPIREDELHRLKRKLAGHSPQYSALVISGSLPTGLKADVYTELVAEAIARNDKVILDADGTALEAGLKSRPYLIKPNRYELERLIGKKLETEAERIEAVKQLVDSGQVGMVILSQGPDPVIFYDGQTLLKAFPPKLEAKSSMGAGDSFLAGFLHQYLNHQDPAESLRWGVACGAACAYAEGTELATERWIKHFLGLVMIESI
jgi:1-phosphofructokinase family hexose kinase